MKKGFLSILIAVFMMKFVFVSYGSTLSVVDVYESSTSTGYEQVRNFTHYHQYMTLKNINVGFTQDDKTYFFTISADATLNANVDIGTSSGNASDIMQPLFYNVENFGNDLEICEETKIPYADYNGGNLHTKSYLKIKGNTIAEMRYVYGYNSKGDLVIAENVSNNNGEKYFIPLAARSSVLSTTSYRYSTGYPISLGNNGAGVSVTKNTSDNLFTTYQSGSAYYVNGITSKINVKIAIEKTYIDDYKYVCFGNNMITRTYARVNTNNKNYTGYSLCTNTINLKSYINCTHDWLVTKSDDTTHTIKCSKCEWEKSENHNYEYSYDGINSDVCACSKIKSVNYYYEINDDTQKTIKNTLAVNSGNNVIITKKKTGYNFKYYEKYKIEFTENNLYKISTKTIPTKETFLENVTAVDTKVSNRSIRYKAVYEPIVYTFNYSDKSNLKQYIVDKLNVKTISPQTFNYDKKQNLKRHIDYDMIVFKGWTLTSGSENIDFNREEEIFNYTTTDKAAYTIYPVYEECKYKILYNTLKGKYDNGLQQSNATYDYYSDEDFVEPDDMGKGLEFSHYTDMNGNSYNTMDELRAAIKNDWIEDQTIILFANSKKSSSSDDSSSNPSGDSSSDTSNDKKSDTENTNDDSSDKKDGDNSDNSNSNDSNSTDSNKSDNEKNKTADDSDKTNSNDNNDKEGDSEQKKNGYRDVNNDKLKDDNLNNDSSNTTNNDTSTIADNYSNNDTNNDSNRGSASGTSESSYNWISYSGGSSDDSGGSKGNSRNISSGIVIYSSEDGKIVGPGAYIKNDTKGSVDGLLDKNSVLDLKNINSNNENYVNENNTLNYFNNKKILMYNDATTDFSNNDNTTDKKENIDLLNFVGPRPLSEEDKLYNVRGTHGPWHFEEKYIFEILRIKKEQENMKDIISSESDVVIDGEDSSDFVDDDNEEVFGNEESINDEYPHSEELSGSGAENNRIKTIIAAIVGALFVICIIIYEILTIKYFKKKNKSK